MTTIKPAVDLAARAAVAARTEELFRASGALREGHFQLKSGRHGDAYVEKFAVLADPAATTELVSFWVAQVRGSAGGDDTGGPRPPVDLVARVQAARTGVDDAGSLLQIERKFGDTRSFHYLSSRLGFAASERRTRRNKSAM